MFATLVEITNPPSAIADTAPGGLFTATQGRILDTRAATTVGGYTTPMPAGSWRSVQVGGNAGVPSTGVSAVSVVLTAVSPLASGYLDAAADGTTPPSLQSYLNYTVGKVAVNTAIIPVGSNGKIKLRASSATDLVVDVQGYYSSGTPGAGAFVPIVPARFVDSQSGLGTPARLNAGSTATLQFGGRLGVPSDATGVAVNITVVNPGAAGSFTVFPADMTSSPVPYNFTNAAATSVGTIAELSPSGALRLKIASTSAHITVDVVGYFKPGEAGGTYNFARGRVLDTLRNVPEGAAAIPANGLLEVKVGGVGDVPALSAAAYDIHVAVTSGSTSGYINLWPGLSAEPATSVLNYPASSTVSNNAIVASSSSDTIRIRNHGSQPIHVVLDIEGWYSTSESPNVPPLPDTGDVMPTGDDEVHIGALIHGATATSMVRLRAEFIPTGGGESLLYLSDYVASGSPAVLTATDVPAGDYTVRVWTDEQDGELSASYVELAGIVVGGLVEPEPPTEVNPAPRGSSLDKAPSSPLTFPIALQTGQSLALSNDASGEARIDLRDPNGNELGSFFPSGMDAAGSAMTLTLSLQGSTANVTVPSPETWQYPATVALVYRKVGDE